jgi:uncharacterized repeat protein (TIGR03803 family)
MRTPLRILLILASQENRMEQRRCWKRAGAAFLLCAAATLYSPAQTFTALASFGETDGGKPYATLVQGADGAFYGTTSEGGSPEGYGNGTVFKVTPGGALTTLYSFAQTAAPPHAGLVLGADGNFYGTTYSLGVANYGGIFEITPAGAPTTLFSFDWTDGAQAAAPLIPGANGDFYGTTELGGTIGAGTIFKIALTGAPATLHNFGITDGADPVGTLAEAADGTLYGTTFYGGAYDDGTVFKIAPEGTLTVMHSFAGADGANPNAGLVQAEDGTFFGTTIVGGSNGYGTVFEITAEGTLTTLHSFDSTDGANPHAGLMLATDGNFYGTTYAGAGLRNLGTIFKMTPSGTLTSPHTFVISGNPYGGLVQGTDGKFYGTTSGTVFSLDVGLGPFVTTVPASGPAGETVMVLGTDLSGTTSVTFDGTPATFSIVSATEIAASVPAGAVSGKVYVTSPRGALRSNRDFRVTANR